MRDDRRALAVGCERIGAADSARSRLTQGGNGIVRGPPLCREPGDQPRCARAGRRIPAAADAVDRARGDQAAAPAPLWPSGSARSRTATILAVRSASRPSTTALSTRRSRLAASRPMIRGNHTSRPRRRRSASRTPSRHRRLRRRRSRAARSRRGRRMVAPATGPGTRSGRCVDRTGAARDQLLWRWLDFWPGATTSTPRGKARRADLQALGASADMTRRAGGESSDLDQLCLA